MLIRRNFLLLTCLALLAASISFSQEAKPAYRDPSGTVEERAADLVKRMTLEEKVDQLAGGRSADGLGRTDEGQLAVAQVRE